MVTSEIGSNLKTQWRNPADVTSLLMVIGGDVVQKALAAGTGTWWFTPVCFSFGWVSYAFMALMNIIANGCLLPQPDYSFKVINLDSGYTRENSNWALGRLMRDCESHLARASLQIPVLPEDNEHQSRQTLPTIAIRITVYRGSTKEECMTSRSIPLMQVHVVGLLCIVVQFGLAAIPLVALNQWDIMMITVIGTLLVQLAGCLPQWTVEKLPSSTKKKAVALTRGNGSQDVVVILGDKTCWDLEAFASPKNPRIQRGWETCYSNRQQAWLQTMTFGYPRGYWLTLVIVVSQSLLWLGLLVNVASERSMQWVLFAIGIIGVFQNGYLASIERDERQLNLQLEKIETIETGKVMDGIMDFEVLYNKGKHLLAEFFNGDLRPDEKLWWRGDTADYNHKRCHESGQMNSKRTPPRNNTPRRP
jgi:hypothetical protein